MYGRTTSVSSSVGLTSGLTNYSVCLSCISDIIFNFNILIVLGVRVTYYEAAYYALFSNLLFTFTIPTNTWVILALYICAKLHYIQYSIMVAILRWFNPLCCKHENNKSIIYIKHNLYFIQ